MADLNKPVIVLVRPQLETELAEAGLTDLFREVEMPLVPVLEGAGGSVTQLDGSPLAYNKPDILNPWFVAKA